MSEFAQNLAISLGTGAATWAAMRVEIWWIKRDMAKRDQREEAANARVSRIENEVSRLMMRAELESKA